MQWRLLSKILVAVLCLQDQIVIARYVWRKLAYTKIPTLHVTCTWMPCTLYQRFSTPVWLKAETALQLRGKRTNVRRRALQRWSKRWTPGCVSLQLWPEAAKTLDHATLHLTFCRPGTITITTMPKCFITWNVRSCATQYSTLRLLWHLGDYQKCH